MSKDMISSFGIKVQIGDGGDPESFVDVAELFDVDGPQLDSEQDDVTTHNSPANWVEKLTTVTDGGQIVFDIGYIPSEATHDETTGLLADYVNRTLRNFKVVFPDPGTKTWAAAALVKGFKPKAPVKGTLRAAVTLEISGEVTFS
jgi:hypothetical protein